jgi:membrane associated rhomboid family serine protease
MLIPLKTDRPLMQTPRANLGLIVTISLMFVVQTAFEGVREALLLRPYEPSLIGFIGSGFLHGGVLHLLGNMLFLYIFGNTINDALGHASYLAFFIGGVAFAALMHSIVETNPALGASGGVFAVTGIYLALFPKTRILLLFFFFIITTVSVPAIWFLGIYFAIDLIQGLDSLLLGSDEGVARWAHFGGATYGFAVGVILLKLGLVPKSQVNVLTMRDKSRQRRRSRAEMLASGQVHGSAMDVVPLAAADQKSLQVQDMKASLRDQLDRGDTSSAAASYEALLGVDERQVLPPAEQLVVAEALYRDGRHASAAKAFQRYLEQYRRSGDSEAARAKLMLGLLLGRYLGQPIPAKRHLAEAAAELDDVGDAEHASFARQEVERLGG